jgi:hypothetical protein
MKWPNLFKNLRSAMLSYDLHERINYFRMKMFILFGLAISVIISSFTPWFAASNGWMLLYFFLVMPLLGWYYVRSTGEDKRNIKKLKAIYNKYVGSLPLEEENAIKNFLLKDCSIEEFQGDNEILKSLELKQIIYKFSCDKKEIYRMERWAFDYFHTYKLNDNIVKII